MRYRSEIPKNRQIRLNEFKLLPGDRICLYHRGVWRAGIVTLVGSANPEYVLGGPNAEGAGVITWEINAREDCKRFLASEHLPVPIRLKKSIWAVVELNPSKRGMRKTKRALYTYDIERMIKKGTLRIL